VAIQKALALATLCGYISQEESYNELSKVFHYRITPVLDKCFIFRRNVKEGVVSKEISPFFIEPGDQFNPLRADLEYEDEGVDQSMNEERLVACSLSVGLFCTLKSRDMNGKAVQTREVILKPKVILQETLRLMIT